MKKGSWLGVLGALSRRLCRACLQRPAASAAATLSLVMTMTMTMPAWAQSPGGSVLHPVSIGFLRHACGAWTAKVADGGFEKATGRTMRWLPFDTDSSIAAAMAGGRVQIGLIGIGVAAAAYARGLPLRVFYAMGRDANSDGLLIADPATLRDGDPRTLMHKVIALPFGSTPHYRLLRSLKQWGLTLQDVRMVNLQVPQIVSAWTQREIDAAAISQPTLGRLATHGRIARLPPANPMDGLVALVADAGFIDKNAVFLARLVDVIARAQASLSDAGTVDAHSDIARAVAFTAGLSPAEAAVAIARFGGPPLEQQNSAAWLAGGSASGVAVAMKEAAETWIWGGLLPPAKLDFGDAIATGPVERALAYKP